MAEDLGLDQEEPKTGPGPGDPPPAKLNPVTPLSAFAQTINQGLKPVPVVSDSFSKSEQVPVASTLVNKDLSTYTPYVNNPDPNDPNLDLKRAEGQSLSEKLLHTGGQFVSGLAGGFLQALGTNLDVKQSIDTLTGTQQEYGNALTRAGEDLIQKSGQAMPVYEKEQGEFNPSDPSWWMNKVAQAGPMVGMAGEALAETAAISYLSAGIGDSGEVGNLTSKFSKLLSLGNNSERMKNSAVMFGLINRHNMSMMSASQTGDEEYKSLIAKGYSEDVARQGAAKAASATYVSQMPLVALDILGFKAMTFNPVTQAAEGGLADAVIDNTFGHISNPLLKSSAILGFEATKGAFEGSWQDLSSDYGRFLADRTVDSKANNSKGEDLNDYIKSSQVENTAASGFIGGLVTGGLFKGYEHLTQGAAKNAMADQYKTFVDGMASTHIELSDKIAQADKEGNEQEANNLRRQLGINKALTSIHLDQLQGENAAFNGYKGFFNTVLDAVNKNDTEALTNMGLAGHEDFLKQAIPQYLADADHIKSIYDDTKETNKPDAVVPITYRKFLIDDLNRELVKTKGDIATTEASIPDLSNLSPSAKAISSSTFNKMAFEAREEKAKRDLVGETDEAKRAELDGIIKHSQYAQGYHQDIIDKNKEIAGNYSDQDILDSIKGNSKLNNLKEQQVDLETTLTGIRKQLAVWEDPKFQTKKTQAKVADVINKTDNSKDIDKTAVALNKQGLLTDEVKQSLIDKKKVLETREEAETLKNKESENETPLSNFVKKANPITAPVPQKEINPFGDTLIADKSDFSHVNLSDERKNISKDVFENPIKPDNNKVNLNDLKVGDSFYHNKNYFTISSKGSTNYTSFATHDLFGESHSLSQFPDEVFKNKPIEDTFSNATIVEDDSLFDPAPLNEDNLTDEKKEGIKTKISDYTNSLKGDIGREPTFRDLVDDFINHTSKDQVDKNFNLLKLGWQLNDKKADFDKVYQDIFGDRKAKGLDFFDFGNDIITEPDRLHEENEVLNVNDQKKQADPGQFDLTENGGKILKPLAGMRTVSSNLKFAHLSLPYLRKVITDEEGHILPQYQNTSDKVNIGEYVDSRELMNPDKWGVGTKGHIRIAEDADNVYITTWNKDFTNGDPIKFGEWAKDKDKTSDEYIGRIPMTIHGTDSKAVAMTHDMEWYNPVNIGYSDDPEQQQSVIDDAKAELLALRKEIINSGGKLPIQVTEKKPGTKYYIPKDKPLKTLAETDPNIKIGYGTKIYNLQTKGGIIEAENFINKEDIKPGFKYELRQAGVDENGKPTYYANKLLYPKIDSDAKMSITQALRVYAYQNDSRTDEGSLKNLEEIKQISKQVLEQTGLDLRSPQDLQKYLNLFIPTENTNVGTGSGDDLAKRVYSSIESNSKLENLTPFISLQKGGVYIGIKGVKIDGTNEVNYFFPGMLGKDSKDPSRGASMINSFLTRIYKDDFLGKMNQNMDGDAIQRDTSVSHIIYDGGKTNVVPSDKYNDYLKKRLQTNLQSFDLGDEGHATFVQPVLNYTYEKALKEDENVESTTTGNSQEKSLEATKELSGVSPETDEEKLINDITSSLPELRSLGLSSEAMKALEGLRKDGEEPSFSPDYESLTDDMVRSIKTKLTKIEDLDTIDRGHIVQFIANEVMDKIDPQKRNSIERKKLLSDIEKTFDDTIAPKVKLVDSKIESLNKLIETGKYPGLQSVVDEFGNFKSNADILKSNWNFLVNEAFEDYINKFTGISVRMNKAQDNIDIEFKDEDKQTPQEINEHEDDQELKIDSNDQREKNYSKESVEDNFQSSIGYLVKRFLAKIPSYDKFGNEKKGFMGVTTYPGFDEYSKSIGSMLSSRGPVISDLEDMKDRLNAYSEAHPFVNEVIKRLDAADEQLKNAFMYNFTRDNLTMKFVMSSFNNKTRKYQLKVYDTNANEILRVIQTQWRNNFNQSPLVNSDNEINTVRAQKLLDQYNSWIGSGKLPSDKEAWDFLEEFGIPLSQDAFKEITTKGYYVSEGKKNILLSYKTKDNKPGPMFGSTGFFGLLGKSLSLMANEKEDKNYIDNDNINPFENMRGVLGKIANIEAKYSTHLTTNSFRDGDKTIFGFTPGKFTTSMVSKLKSDPELLASKQQISFDKASFILGLLSTDQDFADKFNVDHIGINAFKILGKSNYQVNRLNTLSDPDGELTRLGLFQDKQGEVKSQTPNGIPLRIARMFSPTMSDKSGMFDFTTAVLHLKPKDFNLESPTGEMGDHVKDFLFTQLVTSELDRIISHYDRASKNQTNPNFLTNEKGYNLAAQIFNFIPKLNSLDYTQESGESIKLLDFLAHSGGQITPDIRNKIIDKIKPDANETINSLIKNLAKSKIDVWEKNGYIKYPEEGQPTIGYLDHDYMNSIPGTVEEKIKVAANDYVINSIVHEANMHMLLAGDIANYSQDKVFKNRFELDENGNPLTYKPISDKSYTDLSEDIGINLGKRLAMLNAPGNTIAGSKGDKYIQLFAKDRVSPTENLGFLINLYHGKAEEKAATPYINILKTSKDSIERANIINKLSKDYPDLAGYMKIESTDAQEYVTAKEHVDILYRQGRLPVEDYNRISDILDKQKIAEKNGGIPKSLFLDNKDLQLIFQPHKPVVTGQMPDIDNDQSRMIYIKSSAFPLLPQSTQGTELNEVRKGMEDVQDKFNRNVRLSYDTANKVGSPLTSKQIQIWDEQGRYIPGAINAEKLYSDHSNNIPGPTLLMDRENFRIQQDVPYRPEHQMETFGTQMMKEIFGDGVGNITDKIFSHNGEMKSGKDLMNEVNAHMDSWLRNEKSKLYDQLGIDENTGEPTDKLKTIQKLQNLLQNEAKKRGYPKQDIDALEVSPIHDKDGNVQDAQFTIPLWLSPNSNRYEALLNAVVTSRLIDMKLPGGAYVAGSEEGFRNSEEANPHESRTIYTDKWNGSLQPASYGEKGEFNKPQVLAPSKFRDNKGELLDLFKKGPDGKEIYIHKDDQGRWILNNNMVDDEMKSNTAYRIPTSYHQSMSQDETVGYLPPESGNLRIVPKNYTKQKGLDFDIDTEHTYQLWHKIDENNKVTPIEKMGTDLSNYDTDYQDIKDVIDQFQNTLDSNSEVNKLINQYKDEIEVDEQMGFSPNDAKKFIKELKKELDHNTKKSDLKEMVRTLKEFKDLKSKLHQNEIIKAYSSILGSGDPRVQKKINKVLSTDFAENQADLLDGLINKNKDNSNFTVLSDEYQKDKMSAGAVGKTAIGVYANYSVFHSLVQQSEKAIHLTTKDVEGNTVNSTIQIGKFKSDGQLGRAITLDGERNIANIIGGEKLSTATDAEKLRTLERTGINNLTINVDATLTNLGFDKDEATIDGKKQEVSIPYFLLSQPIIRDYVDAMKGVKSNISEFNPNAEFDVINRLITKYSNNGEFDPLDESQVNKERERLTGQKLADNIIDEGNDGVSQQAVLYLFKELRDYGDKLTSVQSKLNIQRNGLGKSMFEMLEKYNNVSALAYNGVVSNIDSLVGHYITGDEFTNADFNQLKDQGYSIFGLGGLGDTLPFAVKPTTATGSLIVHSAKTGYELWNKYFPHSNPQIKKTIDDIISMTSSENISEAKKLEMQYEVFSEMKKYLYSSDKLGLFKGDPQQERERLFMDRDGKESIASYLNKFVRSNHENVGLVRDNKLINKFNYALEKGKSPSIIKYDNSKSEDFNEEYKYQALVELMDKNAPIADFQGKPYTTRMLAQDLAEYSFLEGGIQEAIQFVKYIPVPYLKEIGFSKATELWQRAANGELFMNKEGEVVNLWQQILGNSEKDLETTEYPRFIQQYFQHNPGRLSKFTTDNIDKYEYDPGSKKRNLENLIKFKPKDLDDPKPYIAIYNRDLRQKSKYQIYKWDGENYNRIPTLGAFGMSEYSIKDNNVTPLIDTDRNPIPANLTGEIKQDSQTQQSFFDLDKGHLGNTLKSIEDENLPGSSEVAKLLSPYLNANIKLKVGDVTSNRARGMFSNNEITISQKYLDNPNTTKEQIANTILHEYTHALTSDILSKYFDKKTGALLIPETQLPPDIRRINKLYREVEVKLGSDLDEFREWYTFNSDKGLIRSEADRLLYAGMNVHEFTAMIMSEPDIQSRMSGIPYKESGKSLLEQFVDSIKKVLSQLGIKFNEDSITPHAMDAVIGLLDSQKNESITMNELARNPPDNPFGDIINSSDDDLKGLLDKIDPDYSPEFDPEEIFNPFHGESTVPRTGLTGVVNLKENLLARAKTQLSKITPALEEFKGNAEEYNKLIEQRTQLRDYIFGNDSKGIQGLEKEINEINHIDSRAPEIIAPYVQKEIDRLDILVKSTNPEHLAEARTIVDFIKSMANFNIVDILRNPNGHPIYDTNELFGDENQLLLTPSVTKYFKDWAITADWYTDELSKQDKNVIEHTFNTNPKIQEMYDRKFTYADIINSKTGLKDINWVDMMVMDISAGIFSHNGMMPQVLKSNIDDLFEKHSSWSKEVEENTNSLQTNLDKELIKLGHTQDRLGFIGIHKPSYDIFRQSLPDDVQSGNNFAQKYSYTYLDKYEDMQNKFKTDLQKAYSSPADQTTKNLLFRNTYNARNRWLKNNSLLIDPARLSEITTDPQFKDLEGNFKYSSEEQAAHERQIKNTVGEDYYNEIVKSQKKKIGDYMVQAKNYQESLMKDEGVDNPENLSEGSKQQFLIWKSQNSPFHAVDYSNANIPARVGVNDYHSNFEYNDHIPLRTDINGKELNHYDKNYETIEKNPTLLEFHKFMTKTLGEMYSRFDYDEQEKLSLGSVPLLDRKRDEIFMDNNLNFFQAISKAFRDWWDNFKGGFGIRVQDQFNYAKVNPNTGLPDYKVNDSFIKQNLRSIQDLAKIKGTKFINEYNRNVNDTSKLDVGKFGKFTSIPKEAVDNYTLNLINKFTGKDYTRQELVQQYGDSIPVGKIIYQNAQHQIAQNKSFDLPKILKYFSHLTAQYAARKEALPIAELMKNHYQSIQSQVTQNTDDPKININKDGTERNYQLNGLRTNANKQFDNWFQRVILGNQGLVKHFGIMKAGDKMTPEENQNFLNKAFSAIASATHFDGKIYDIQEKKVIAQIDESINGLGDTEADNKTRAELENIKSNLGKDAALSATLSSILNFTRFKMLAFNLSSSVHNLIDGQVANTISAASGNYFPAEYLHELSLMDIVRSDLIKQINPGAMDPKVAKAYYMAKKMDIFQDNTNELQKASSQSAVSNLNKFGKYYTFTKSELYNQMPIVVATLKDHKITGINGERSNVWDAMNGEYSPRTKQWDFKLKPEFATEENKKAWNDYNGQDYFNYKSKARQVIRDTHSHGLDPTAGQMAKSTILGQALTMFKTFLPREFYKRFAVPQDNIAAGIEGFRGRYRSLTGVQGAIQGGITGGYILGLPGMIGGSILGGLLGNHYGPTIATDILSQTLEVNKILFKKLMGMPVNPLSRMFTGKNIIDTSIPDELNQKFNFSKQDFANFKANMQSMSTQMAYLGLLMLTKALFWDDKDKSDSTRRETHNLLANRLMQLAGESTLYLNPVEVGTTVLAIPTLQLFKNIGETTLAVDKFMKGHDTLLSGPNAGHSRLLGDLRKSFVPGIGSSGDLGFAPQMQKQYTPSPVDDYFHNDETKTKEQKKEERASRRAELNTQLEETIPDEGERHAHITKILNKEFPPAKSTHHKAIGLYN